VVSPAGWLQTQRFDQTVALVRFLPGFLKRVGRERTRTIGKPEARFRWGHFHLSFLVAVQACTKSAAAPSRPVFVYQAFPPTPH